MTDDQEFVKVRFRLEERRPGWPPGESEGLWAKPEPDGYRLDNVPFFVLGHALHDVVTAVPDADGTLWAGDVVRESGNCTIWVFLTGDGTYEENWRAAKDRFAVLGVDGEGFGQFDLLAMTVPPEADLAAVVRLLDDGTADGSWTYEEGWVTPAWHAAR